MALSLQEPGDPPLLIPATAPARPPSPTNGQRRLLSGLSTSPLAFLPGCFHSGQRVLSSSKSDLALLCSAASHAPCASLGCQGRDITGLKTPHPRPGCFCDFSSYLLLLLTLQPGDTLASSCFHSRLCTCLPQGLCTGSSCCLDLSSPVVPVSLLGCVLFSDATLTTLYHIALTPLPSPEPSLLYFSVYFSPSHLL